MAFKSKRGQSMWEPTIFMPCSSGSEPTTARMTDLPFWFQYTLSPAFRAVYSDKGLNPASSAWRMISLAASRSVLAVSRKRRYAALYSSMRRRSSEEKRAHALCSISNAFMCILL